MSGVELRDVSKAFGTTSIIKNVDLAIQDGEFCVFVGPSGCGKSTLLRMIAGLETLSSGHLAIGGVDMTHTDAAQRGVAMVFQSYALYPHMTVAQNMGYAMQIARRPAGEIRDAVAAVAAMLDLTPQLQRKPKTLSGGQRQRVAIGRAILRNPKVFLFDEPLSNLDAELRITMRMEIAALHRRLGATMIYVTHDQVEAMTLADRLVVLRDGRIEQVGRPLDLYHNPDNRFVAGFLGTPRISFLPAIVTGQTADTVVLTVEDSPRHIEVALTGPKPETGSGVDIGIRPEKVTITPDGPLQLTVTALENLGAHSIVYGKTLKGHSFTIASDINLDGEVSVGQTIRAEIEQKAALVFDLTGQRLR